MIYKIAFIAFATSHVIGIFCDKKYTDSFVYVINTIICILMVVLQIVFGGK